MTVRLSPASRLRGRLCVPGDKSISHRAVILNGLARGDARVRGFSAAADTLASIGAMTALGVSVERVDDGATVLVRSPGRRRLHEAAGPVDCGNSGTTMRLVAGVAAGLDALTVLDGDASLRRRPMDRVLQPLASMGARVDGRAGRTLAPITVRGGALRPFQGGLEVASAQVKSAVLLAALAASGPSTVAEPVPTRDHTEILLGAMGVALTRTGRAVRIEPPGDALRPVDVDVPGDLSAAAFWLVAGSITPESEIELPAVGINPTRAGVIEVLRAMGADIAVSGERTVAGEPVADLTVRSASLRGTTIAGELIPRTIDELPVLAVAAALADGITEIRDAAELRVKESDRIAATAAGLRALGARIEERPDGLVIEGKERLQGARVDSQGDHRLAMALAVAALAAEGETELHGEDAVNVSYAAFWSDFQSLAGAATLA